MIQYIIVLIGKVMLKKTGQDVVITNSAYTQARAKLNYSF